MLKKQRQEMPKKDKEYRTLNTNIRKNVSRQKRSGSMNSVQKQKE